MLAEAKLNQLKSLSGTLSSDELIWSQGFLAGVLSTKSGGSQAVEVAPSSVETKKITILYGTETGNCKGLATRFAQKSKQSGLITKLTSLDQYKLTDLTKEENLVVVISTHGEGEPPAMAKKFHTFIHQEELSVGQLHYAVLALGDSAYPLFCKAGEDIDNQLSALGAKRIHPIQKCDVNFETEASNWFEQIIPLVKNAKSHTPVSAGKSLVKKSGRKFYPGVISSSINLNGRGSNKETYHIEIQCKEKIDYQPGDALGIIPENRKDIVHQILKLTGADALATVTTTKATATVKELLTRHLNICHLSTSNLKNYASITGHTIPDIRMDLVEVLRIYPVKDSQQFLEVVKTLSPIAPRLYSISSSPSAHENEIHITVAQHTFRIDEEIKFGLCSQFIGTLEPGTALDFYIHENRQFKLPAPDKDLIMIGPGSGIAAMRSFLYERESTGATGRNWLFFGDQHFTSDFLYQTEIQKWLETGLLTKLSVAFSRDQQEKIYVQHKLAAHQDELYQWIENGASVYVSGTKNPMSHDVENVLLNIFQHEGNQSKASATQQLEELKEQNRYLLDVY